MEIKNKWWCWLFLSVQYFKLFKPWLVSALIFVNALKYFFLKAKSVIRTHIMENKNWNFLSWYFPSCFVHTRLAMFAILLLLKSMWTSSYDTRAATFKLGRPTYIHTYYLDQSTSFYYRKVTLSWVCCLSMQLIKV